MNDKINFKASDEGGLDEFFRKTLEGHRVEPKPTLWKGMSRTMLWRELAHFNFTNLSTKLRVTGALGLLILAVALYNIFSTPPPAVPLTIATSTSGRIVNSPVREITHTSSAPLHKGNQPAVHSAKTYNNPNQGGATGKSNKATSSKSPESLAYAKKIPKHTISHQTNDNFVTTEYSFTTPAEKTDIAVFSGQTDISPIIPFETAFHLISPHVDTIITINNAFGISRFLKTKPTATQFFSVNLGVIPEMSFYAEPEAYSKMNVWINGGLTWHFSRFSLSINPGLGYVYDKGKYRVEYKSNDSVGYFTNVLSYTIGANNEIIYNTVNENIYDSLTHQNDYRTMNRFSYLQVPLLLGYRFFESDRVSLTFQAGPAVSFLLGSRKSASVIEYTNARIIRVDDNTPSRVHTNWQVWGDLFLEIRMNKKISIYFEPSFKYFLNSIVEQENVSFKAPWSVGLGIGIQFNFAAKKKNP